MASPAPSAKPVRGIRYVTIAQASGLATSPVKPGVPRSLASGPLTFEYCDYIFDPGNAPGVMVAGVRDEAFYGSGNLNVRKGNKGLIVFVGRINSQPRGPKALPDEKQLAALICPSCKAFALACPRPLGVGVFRVEVLPFP